MEWITSLRGKVVGLHNLRTPDSIQMATAITGGDSLFLTNDTRLPSLPGLKTLILDNLKEDS